MRNIGFISLFCGVAIALGNVCAADDDAPTRVVDDIGDINRFIFPEDNAGISISPSGEVVRAKNWRRVENKRAQKEFTNTYWNIFNGVRDKPDGSQDHSRWLFIEKHGPGSGKQHSQFYPIQFPDQIINRVIALEKGKIKYVANCGGHRYSLIGLGRNSADRTCMAINLNVCNQLYTAAGVATAEDFQTLKAQCDKLNSSFADAKVFDAIKVATAINHDDIVSKLNSIQVKGEVGLDQRLSTDQAKWVGSSSTDIDRESLISICKGLDATRKNPQPTVEQAKSIESTH